MGIPVSEESMSPASRPGRFASRAALALVLASVCLGATGCRPTSLGIFLPFINGAVGPNEITTEASALGVHTVRFSQDVTQPVRPAFATFERLGMKVVLDVHNDPQPNANGHNVSHPPDTPEEVATFRQQVANALDGMPPPRLVQVENEENSTSFFQGQMSDYMNELNATVEVAHARKIKVTNGGITSSPLALLTWQDFKDRGLDAAADDFAVRVFSDQPRILQDLRTEPFAGLRSESLQAAWDRAKQLIPMFRQSAMDYVNFHWYEDNSQALREAAEYLARATGKPIVTTEIGQHNTNPDVVTGHLTTLVERLDLRLALWFDADGIPAMGLHDQPGQLRPNGEAFKSFVASHTNALD
jgi:hypothetical protein